MSFVTIYNIRGTLTSDEKALMLRRVIDAVVSVKGEGNRAGVSAVVQEIDSGDWGVGGWNRTLTAEDVARAHETGQPPSP